jgi:multidrug transporter EmrE-like cation transporter
MNNLVSILLALFGFTLFSTGIVLTKAGSPWMKWQGQKDSNYRRYLAIWFAGFALYNLALIPNGMASQNLPPHIISAISGWGITVIVFLSHFFLKEKIHVSDYIYSMIIIASIFILNIAEKPTAVTQIDKPAFYLLFLIPFLLVIPAFLKQINVKMKSVLYSVYAGCASGFALVILNIVVKEYGYDLVNYFGTPYPYLFIFSGTAAFVALQLAIKYGDMMLVGPLQNSFAIIYPTISSYFVFSSKFNIIQIAAIIAIVYACIAILRKH